MQKKFMVRCSRCQVKEVFIIASLWRRFLYRYFNILPKVICSKCQIDHVQAEARHAIDEITAVPDHYREVR